MRRWMLLPALALLAGLAPGALAQQAGGPDTFTPRPAPTADLQKLTVRAATGKAIPQPRAALLPAPVVAPPLSPLMAPVAPPVVEAKAVDVATAVTAGPLPARKPERAPAKPPAVSAPPKASYAKASKEDRGCALPDDMPDHRRSTAPGLAVGSTARVLADANLRVAPFCDAKVKDVLEVGETVTVMGVQGRWYQVGRRGKAMGYVGAALLAGVKKR
jgi:Bacterial SH3 domain.